MGKPRYVDVNVFVYWIGGHPTHGQRDLEWVRRIEKAKKGEFITSSLTLYETAVIIAGLLGVSLKDLELTRRIINAITQLSGLDVIELRLEDFQAGLKLMEAYKLDLEDALHLAVALRREASEIVSFDKDFDRTPLPRTL